MSNEGKSIQNESQRMCINLGKNATIFPAGYTRGVRSGILDLLQSVTEPPATSQANAGGLVLNTARTGLIRYPRPVNVPMLYALKDISGHHSTCIQTKKYSTVGLGFVDEGGTTAKATSTEEAAAQAASLLSGKAHVESKVDRMLDPYTFFGFHNELLDICEDFMDTGTGYLEVHRTDAGVIDGLAQIPANDVWFCTYKNHVFFQYQSIGTVGPVTKYWSSFGLKEKNWLLSAEGPFSNAPDIAPSTVSEIIPFIQPSNRIKFYGYPDWLSAAVDIDLLRKAKQYKADFYHNRGVLDKVLVVSGTEVDPTKWKAIEEAMGSSIGSGNNFASMTLNFAEEGAAVQVLSLGPEGKTEEQYATDVETLTQSIVSSHGVPYLLANILISGKLGASNEFLNSLISFQLLRVNGYQNVFEKTLAKTLAGPEGLKGLEADDFRLRTLTSQIDIAGVDTLGKMQTSATDPDNAGRDLSEGVKT